MLSVTLEKTVGLMKNPLSPNLSPPNSSVAPSFFPLIDEGQDLFRNCSSSICGP